MLNSFAYTDEYEKVKYYSHTLSSKHTLIQQYTMLSKISNASDALLRLIRKEMEDNDKVRKGRVK